MVDMLQSTLESSQSIQRLSSKHDVGHAPDNLVAAANNLVDYDDYL